MYDPISIEVGGSEYTGWKSISVRRTMEAMAGYFNFTSMDKWSVNNEAWELFPGRRVRVRVGREELLEGYIDSLDADISPDSHEISVSGRDRTADLIDCSASSKPGSWRKLNILQIAQRMAEPFGIKVSADASLGAPFPVWRVQSGETVYESLSKAAAKRGVLLLSGRVGNLTITNSGNKRAHDSLVLGENVSRATGSFDYTNRFSTYRVKGATKDVGTGWTATTVSVYGDSNDGEVLRYRPLVIRGNGIQSTKDAQTQVRWEANVRAAKSFRATVAVSGFRQSNGDLWENNHVVSVDIPGLLLNSDMLITSVEYKQDVAGGSVTTMELSRPDAFQQEPPEAVKPLSNNLGWGTGKADKQETGDEDL